MPEIQWLNKTQFSVCCKLSQADLTHPPFSLRLSHRAGRLSPWAFMILLQGKKGCCAISNVTFSQDKISSVQSLSRVRLFATPWTTAGQASLSITNSQSLPKLMSIETVISSNHLIFCCPLLLLPSIFPASGSFPMSQLIASGGQSCGVSASTSVLPMNIQDWSPLEGTSWISLQSKGLSRVFSNTTIQKHQFFYTQLSS